jgi:hypothetical protein
MTISPNPFTDILVVEVDNDNFLPANLELANMVGEVVYTHRITTNNTIIDTSNLLRGLYAVSLIHDKREVFREMMMHN